MDTNTIEDSCPICGEPLDVHGFHAKTGQVHCNQAVYDAVDGEERYQEDHEEDAPDYGQQLEDGFGMMENF